MVKSRGMIKIILLRAVLFTACVVVGTGGLNALLSDWLGKFDQWGKSHFDPYVKLCLNLSRLFNHFWRKNLTKIVRRWSFVYLRASSYELG